MIEVDEVTTPACWASYLVNGDASGLDEDDVAACDAKVEEWAAEGWSVVDVVRDDGGDSEPYFSWSFGLHGGTARGGDLLEYVVHRHSVGCDEPPFDYSDDEDGREDDHDAQGELFS